VVRDSLSGMVDNIASHRDILTGGRGGSLAATQKIFLGQVRHLLLVDVAYQGYVSWPVPEPLPSALWLHDIANKVWWEEARFRRR
jgi:hypothetical protein